MFSSTLLMLSSGEITSLPLGMTDQCSLSYVLVLSQAIKNGLISGARGHWGKFGDLIITNGSCIVTRLQGSQEGIQRHTIGQVCLRLPRVIFGLITTPFDQIMNIP